MDTYSMKVGNQRPQKEIYIIEIKPSLSGTYPQFIDSQGIPLQILQNTPLHVVTKDDQYSSIPSISYKSQDQMNVTLANETSDKASEIDDNFQALTTETLRIEAPTVFTCIPMSNIVKQRQMEDKTKITQDYVHIPDKPVLQRAIAVLPSTLQLRRGIVTPRKLLPPRVRFGPIQGIKRIISPNEVNDLKTKAALNKTPLYLLKENNQTIHLDVSDKDKANWLCLLPLGEQDTANVWIYEDDGELYGITTHVIPTRNALSLGYSKAYCDEHKFADAMPVKDLDEEYAAASKEQWWCYECRKQMTSATSLQRHMQAHHHEEKAIPQKRYRCRNCTRSFCRLFTLKRHLAQHCLKKDFITQEKLNNSEQNLTDSSHNFSQTLDDNRTPSDESFQNYTNGLDFSTNLFDDRMAGLDISNSRPETEYNPYSLDDRVDNLLTSQLDFPNTMQQNEINNENIPVHETKTLVSCTVCNKDVEKENKRVHLKECRRSSLRCECGRVFKSKISLAEHIHSDHTSKITDNTELKLAPVSTNEYNYTCEVCEQKFKRRGILVNHLWRVHNISDSKVPLEKRVRHFPCVVCPKVYGTAAKRNQHVRVHHPGAEKIPAQSIEGGVRVYEPAQCSFCPRQYATRAKMLQHARLHHPHLMKRRVEEK
ncbi:PR domain zinc finger protein 10 isoform X2 [Bombyx mori]|uniref:C2H2-type domain-containing protein n=1 Tax=Bombyx mori TaxID=7091 RepID=A0A8R2AKB7_BOMMO|nr:PR domain zinc finger protein 10 isoform X2 [Bombyx mori]